MIAYEVNFDGLVGPTHNYAGLSFGNVASHNNAGNISNPKAAAQQGLNKMQALFRMGLKQAVLPPHERIHIPTLKRLGFSGTHDAEILLNTWKKAPELLALCSSASAMWVANAATVSPKYDSADNRTHFTPANLSSMFHRSIEPATTAKILKAIFSDPKRFAHHPSLPSGIHFGDEGAANHTRFCQQYHQTGTELFVYGAYAFRSEQTKPARFPARQTFEASLAISRLHQLPSKRTVFAQQNPEVIDAGVFHNDVISVGNQNVFLFHELAFCDKKKVLSDLETALQMPLYKLEVPEHRIAASDAVNTYLFNTQLLTIDEANNKMVIIAPTECQEHKTVSAYLQELTEQDNPIDQVHYFDLRQSMKNGGGPACLRLRVVLDDEDLNSIKANVLLDEALIKQLSQWIDKHYREQIAVEDIADPALLTESRQALDELTAILKLGSVYDFQQN